MNDVCKYGVSERLKGFCKMLNISVIEFEKSLNFANGYIKRTLDDSQQQNAQLLQELKEVNKMLQ